jgi:hypothetical protein
VLLIGVTVLLGLYLVRAFWSWTRVDVEIEGLADGAYLQPAAAEGLDIRLAVDPAARAEDAEVTLDGRQLEPEQVERTDGVVRVLPGQLNPGEHRLELTVGRPVLDDANFEWAFVIDGSAPGIEVASPISVDVCEPVTVTGHVEPDAVLTVNGEEVDHDDGRFTLRYDRPPAAPLALVATDPAGNASTGEVVFAPKYPGTQGLHVTAAAWGYEPLRQHVLSMVDAGLVSVVELDLKDENGVVGYDSEVEAASAAGAVRPEYDLEDALELLHDRGVRVIGRIVAFRDPVLAEWAWANGRPEWVVQTPSGAPHGSYGGFTNFANADVRAYNIDLAVEAADAGIDEILWDYVRRPEGDPAGMVFPGMTGTPEDGVVGFLAESHQELRERCVLQGASVFGIAADRPAAVAQDIPRIARNVDYIAPMLYPSHWVDGEYGVDNPNAQPYDIVRAALADFQAKAAGTGVAMVPWLQDFSLGHPYGPAEVQAQINAAGSLGIQSWLLWNPAVQYTVDALTPGLVTAEPPP